jgi:hypothetical protein
MNITDRALVVLACYDFESLQITLNALEYTIDKNEIVVIILNGVNTHASAVVERISRTWAGLSPGNRFVVRPLCSGAKAFYAITEVLANYKPLEKIRYICKIDDDIIPLKKDWLNELAGAYLNLSRQRKIGFTTGLINNNCWGFNVLLDIYDKRKDYEIMFNYKTRAGDPDKFKPGQINDGFYGTVWQEPYCAWWVHQWTSLQIQSFLDQTASLSYAVIPPETGYSIGCLFFEKQFWLDLDPAKYNSIIDEEIIHFTCADNGKGKWVVMNQPIIHLFYFNQRLANRDILDPIINALCSHFNSGVFKSITRIGTDELILNLSESVKALNNDLMTFLNALVADENLK